MHYPWPTDGEKALSLGTPIHKVKLLLENDMFPVYIKQTLDKYISKSDSDTEEYSPIYRI